MLNILLRTLIVYILLVVAMRIGGKRQIGQLQLSELVSALLLSEIAAMPIGHEEIPLTFAVIPIVTVICVEIICSFAVTKSKKLSAVFDGKPSVIINKGKLNIAEMKKIHLGIEEFIVEARQKGISDISDLQYAILESGGELSVFKKESSKSSENTPSIAPVTEKTANITPSATEKTNTSDISKNNHSDKAKNIPTDTQKNTSATSKTAQTDTAKNPPTFVPKSSTPQPKPDKGIAHVIISDGEVSEQGLSSVGLTRKALNGKLRTKKLTAEELFLYTIDDAGNEFAVKKEEFK